MVFAMGDDHKRKEEENKEKFRRDRRFVCKRVATVVGTAFVPELFVTACAEAVNTYTRTAPSPNPDVRIATPSATMGKETLNNVFSTPSPQKTEAVVSTATLDKNKLTIGQPDGDSLFEGLKYAKGGLVINGMKFENMNPGCTLAVDMENVAYEILSQQFLNENGILVGTAVNPDYLERVLAMETNKNGESIGKHTVVTDNGEVSYRVDKVGEYIYRDALGKYLLNLEQGVNGYAVVFKQRGKLMWGCVDGDYILDERIMRDAFSTLDEIAQQNRFITNVAGLITESMYLERNRQNGLTGSLVVTDQKGIAYRQKFLNPDVESKADGWETAVNIGYHNSYLREKYARCEFGKYEQGGEEYDCLYGLKANGASALIGMNYTIGGSERMYPADAYAGKDGMNMAAVYRFDGYNRLVHPNETSTDLLMGKFFDAVNKQRGIGDSEKTAAEADGIMSFWAPFQVPNEWAEKWEEVNVDLKKPVLVWQIMNKMPEDFPDDWGDKWLRTPNGSQDIMNSGYGWMVGLNRQGLAVVSIRATSDGKSYQYNHKVSEHVFEEGVLINSSGWLSICLASIGLWAGKNEVNKIHDVYHWGVSNGYSLSRKNDEQYEVYVYEDQ